MTTTNNTSANKINFRLIALFVLLVLSTGAFAQNTPATVLPATTSTEVAAAKATEMVITTDNTVASNTDFAVWFTGNKQNEGSTVTNSTNFGKKQLINSGVKNAGVLIRSFLKKVISSESNVA